jgi:uncharacterized delta-60 repeat protein
MKPKHHLRRLLGLMSCVSLSIGAQDFGSVDLTFGGENTVSGTVSLIHVLPDDRILIAGTFHQVDGENRSRIARLLPDGSLDAGFNPGTGISDGNINVIRTQADGRVLLAGNFSTVNGLQRHRIVRLHPDGSVDQSFIPPLVTMGSALLNDVLVQSDGRIIVGGSFTNFAGVSRTNLARLHPDGSLDLSFVPPGTSQPAINALLPVADGRFLAGTRAFSFGPSADSTLQRTYAARFNAAGDWDPTFVFQAAAGANLNTQASVDFFLPLPGGDVLLGGITSGNATAYNGVMKVNADGVMDGNFRTGPVSVGSLARSFRSAVRLPSGHLVGGGQFTTVQGQSHTNVVALLPDGTVNPDFDVGTGPNIPVDAVAAQADGRILIGGGFSTVNGHARRGIARLHGPGSAPVITRQPVSQTRFSGENAVLDIGVIGDPEPSVQWFRQGDATSVGSGPRLTLEQIGLLTHAGEYHAVVANTQGQATSSTVTLTVELAAPEFTREPVDLRISQLGLAVFSAEAAGSQPISYQWYVNDQPVEGGTGPELNIKPALVGGHPFSGSPAGTYRVVAENALGSRSSASVSYQFSSVCVVDPTFWTVREWIRVTSGCGGGCEFTSTFNLNGTRQIQLGADGRVYAVGNWGSWTPGVIVLRPDGQIDGSFHPFPAPNVRPEALQLLPNGQMLVGGNFTEFGGVPRGKIARLNPNGSVDESFQAEIIGSGRVTRIVRQTDGQLLIGGSFTNVNGVTQRGVARLMPNGTIDPSFQSAVLGGGGSFVVDALGLQPDGRILFGGYAQNFWRFPGGHVRRHLARLHPNGSLDLSFEAALQTEGGFAGSLVNDLLIAPDGRVYVAGVFSLVEGTPRRRLARLFADGRLDPSFDPGTGPSATTGNSVITLEFDGQGRLLAGGFFSTFSGQPANGLVRLWPDGSVDSAFGLLHGTSGSQVNALAVQPDGRIVLGGQVSSPRIRVPQLDIELYCTANNPPRFMATICRFQAKADGLFRIYGGDSVVAPPTIVNPPQDALALVQSTMLTVDVAGTPPLTYEWFRDGTPVSNSDTPLLGIAADRPGSYHVVVSNEYGTAISEAAQVAGLSTHAEAQVVQFGAEGFSLSLQPPTGQEFTTQDVDQLSVAATEDFQTWFPLSNALRLIDGRIELTDPEAAAHAHRFYRFGLEQPAP